jgi:TonB family protein
MKPIMHSTRPLLLWACVLVTLLAAPTGAAELGTWWRDSDVVRGLQLRDSQIKQIEQAFVARRTELNTLAADLQRQEDLLQSLVFTANLDEKRAAAQIDQVVMARARLEKAKTMMALDIRCAVSFDQWKRLQEMQREQTGAAPAPGTNATKSAPKAESSPSISEEPVYQIGGPVSDPVPIQKPMPDFTAEARTRKVQGNILLSVVIAKDGAVRNVKVLRGLGFGLDESAVDTVTKKWLFKPSTMNGQPVSVQANIEVSFRMQK